MGLRGSRRVLLGQNGGARAVDTSTTLEMEDDTTSITLEDDATAYDLEGSS
jgi:hypothetical protein